VTSSGPRLCDAISDRKSGKAAEQEAKEKQRLADKQAAAKKQATVAAPKPAAPAPAPKPSSDPQAKEGAAELASDLAEMIIMTAEFSDVVAEPDSESVNLAAAGEGGFSIDPMQHAEAVAAKKTEAAQTEALMQEAARLITWDIGQVIDVDTEDGLEKGATIIAPPTNGDETQMRVRFKDGSEDDWDIEDFVALKSDLAVPGKNTAAIALQQELLNNGTSDVEKIQRLRRASMQPDEKGASDADVAMMAAAAAEIPEDDAEQDGATSDDHGATSDDHDAGGGGGDDDEEDLDVDLEALAAELEDGDDDVDALAAELAAGDDGGDDDADGGSPDLDDMMAELGGDDEEEEDLEAMMAELG